MTLEVNLLALDLLQGFFYFFVKSFFLIKNITFTIILFHKALNCPMV